MLEGIQLCRGGFGYQAAATMQMGGGTSDTTPSFATDNQDDPGNMTTIGVGPFHALVTAMIGGSVNTAYNSLVTLTCTVFPPGFAPTIVVGGVVDGQLTNWTAGVCTDLIELFFPINDTYTFQLDDTVTLSFFDVESLP
jgi:hypothetical protein